MSMTVQIAGLFSKSSVEIKEDLDLIREEVFSKSKDILKEELITSAYADFDYIVLKNKHPLLFQRENCFQPEHSPFHMTYKRAITELDEVKKKGYKRSFFDISLSCQIYEHPSDSNQSLIVFFTSQSSLADYIIKRLSGIEYSYTDSVDSTLKISQESWKERGEVWSELLKDIHKFSDKGEGVELISLDRAIQILAEFKENISNDKVKSIETIQKRAIDIAFLTDAIQLPEDVLEDLKAARFSSYMKFRRKMIEESEEFKSIVDLFKKDILTDVSLYDLKNPPITHKESPKLIPKI